MPEGGLFEIHPGEWMVQVESHEVHVVSVMASGNMQLCYASQVAEVEIGLSRTMG